MMSRRRGVHRDDAGAPPPSAPKYGFGSGVEMLPVPATSRGARSGRATPLNILLATMAAAAVVVMCVFLWGWLYEEEVVAHGGAGATPGANPLPPRAQAPKVVEPFNSAPAKELLLQSAARGAQTQAPSDDRQAEMMGSETVGGEAEKGQAEDSPDGGQARPLDGDPEEETGGGGEQGDGRGHVVEEEKAENEEAVEELEQLQVEYGPAGEEHEQPQVEDEQALVEDEQALVEDKQPEVEDGQGVVQEEDEQLPIPSDEEGGKKELGVDAAQRDVDTKGEVPEVGHGARGESTEGAEEHGGGGGSNESASGGGGMGSAGGMATGGLEGKVALENAEGDNGQEEGNEDLQAEDGEDRTDDRLDEHLKQEHQEPEGHGAIEQQEEPVGDRALERVQQATPGGEGAVQAGQEVLTGDVVGEQQDAVPAQEQKQGAVHGLSHKTMGPGQLPSDIEVPTELGFHPDDLPEFSAEVFECDGGSIDIERVNDNYCDCADGTDEPGTGACGNGKLWCHYEQRFIFSSMVRDGICDCCDGSDEYQFTKCDNTCT